MTRSTALTVCKEKIVEANKDSNRIKAILVVDCFLNSFILLFLLLYLEEFDDSSFKNQFCGQYLHIKACSRVSTDRKLKSTSKYRVLNR